MTDKCIELVKKFEGFSPTLYYCPAGYPTIGYGHLVSPEEMPLFKDKILSKGEAEILLILDLLKVENLLRFGKYIMVYMHPYMWDAIISFVYNIGLSKFKISTLRRKINNKEFIDASNEFLKWIYAGGKKLKGLIRRREAERELFLEGVRMLG